MSMRKIVALWSVTLSPLNTIRHTKEIMSSLGQFLRHNPNFAKRNKLRSILTEFYWGVAYLGYHHDLFILGGDRWGAPYAWSIWQSHKTLIDVYLLMYMRYTHRFCHTYKLFDPGFCNFVCISISRIFITHAALTIISNVFWWTMRTHKLHTTSLYQYRSVPGWIMPARLFICHGLLWTSIGQGAASNSMRIYMHLKTGVGSSVSLIISLDMFLPH